MTSGQMQGLPEFVNCILIDRLNNNKKSHLPHVHENELELFYVYAGTGQYMVDNRLYPICEGDIVICNAGVLHGEDPALVRQIHSYSVAMTGVQFEGLPPNCLIDDKAYPVVPCGQLSGHVGQLMQLIYMLSADTEHLGGLCSSLGYSMLMLAQALVRSRARNEAIDEKEQPSVLAHRVRQYLDGHYSEQMTLRQVAERLHVSEYYLAHVFKQEFGVPPMQYVMKRRIGEAQELLMNTNLSIAEVADRLGYSSVCHFNAMFKKNVGMPPGKFRQSFQSKDGEGEA